MTSVSPSPSESVAARHARLFELIRQQTLAAQVTPHQPAAAPQHTVNEFARAARRSLLPQEQEALGYSASFGR